MCVFLKRLNYNRLCFFDRNMVKNMSGVVVVLVLFSLFLESTTGRSLDSNDSAASPMRLEDCKNECRDVCHKVCPGGIRENCRDECKEECGKVCRVPIKIVDPLIKYGLTTRRLTGCHIECRNECHKVCPGGIRENCLDICKPRCGKVCNPTGEAL